MRKFQNLLSLRNSIHYYPRHCYCIHLKIQKGHVLHMRSKFQTLSSCKYFSLLSPQDSAENGIKQLSEEFPEPKKILWRIVNEAFAVYKKLDIKPIITIQQISTDKNDFKWQVTLVMNWPDRFQVEGIANKKLDAENLAYLLACQKMKTYGMLDCNNKPLLPNNITILSDFSIKTAKGELGNIFQRIWTQFGNKEYIPKFNTVQVKGIFGSENYWKSELHLTYPEANVFEGYAVRLRDAENIAAAKALHWLYEQEIISKKKKLIQYSKAEALKLQEYHSTPYSICIPPAIQDKMTSVLIQLESETVNFQFEEREVEDKIKNEEIMEPEIRDIFTDKMYYVPSDEEILNRSRELFEKNVLLQESSEPAMKEIKIARSMLPIYQKREDIIRLIEDNQIVVLSGETGCGKTTQVPQFILEHYINQMKGANCNIVITQPRRISAISIAERVATERNEEVGETVGYHVRLNKNLPQKRGAVLYCSTGMLLRKLCSNPNFEGVSHVIVDEIHERNIQIDFLLILLRNLLKENKSIKIILMSASFNTYIFSQYFNKCPIIHIPGKVYPVKEYFLEDLKDIIPSIKQCGKKDPVLDVDLIVNAINHIDANEKPGAILCFLPGWHEICAVHSKLLSNENTSRLMICPAHSRLPHEEQKNIFKKSPDGIRKVILATNIAETSITVDDVVYVVNSGLHKGTSFDSERGITSLGTQWITKANVRQRRGRAGRVQPGICYHLITRKVFMEMDEYPMPEILRMPLESVILDCKLYCPDSKAEDFLSLALQPPSRSALHIGVNELQISGVLDEDENLTTLGRIIVNFATHPRLSVALVYAAFLRCLNPVLTICSMLTLGKEPFLNNLDDKSRIKQIKQAHDNYLYSDHLALNKIFETWETLDEESDVTNFIENNLLDYQNLDFIKKLKALFAEDLYTIGIIDDRNAFADPSNDCNLNSTHIPSILASLTAAFYPNVMKVMQGEIAHCRLNKNAIIYSLIKEQKGYIQKESVASSEYELPTPWLIYYSALQSEARRLMMTSSVSSVPGICLLLFAGKELSLSTDVNVKNMNESILCVDNIKKLNFSCSREEANLLISWRNLLHESFQSYIQSLGKTEAEEGNKLNKINASFMPVLKEILETPQVPFTKGQFYKFVNNRLVSEEL